MKSQQKIIDFFAVRGVAVESDEPPIFLEKYAYDSLSSSEKFWVDAHDFDTSSQYILPMPSHTGSIGKYVYKCGDDFWLGAKVCRALPAKGVYKVSCETDDFILGWALESYNFTLSSSKKLSPCLIIDKSRYQRLTPLLEAIYLARTLINLPASHLTTTDLCGYARLWAEQHGARFSSLEGNALLAQDFNMIHAVGRASIHPPYLVDIEWGNPSHPSLTLVGKGVVYDTGGLDIKNSAAMKLMKKDMGGAAYVLGIAHALIKTQVPVHIRILIPIADNAISGSSFRTGDVLRAKNGIAVEVTNTDAEGRLLLADALSVVGDTDLLISCATLTGASRIALGMDVPSVFSSPSHCAQNLSDLSMRLNDPVWPLPLWLPYKDMLKSYVADIASAAASGYGGAITAALFLQKFMPEGVPFIHMDTSAWNLSDRPGRPLGGEAFGLRCLYTYIREFLSV